VIRMYVFIPLNTSMRITELKSPEPLLEGGNVFKSLSGEVLTKRINKQDIDPTLRSLEPFVKIPLADNTIGSVGKKESSGDIDVLVDPHMISKDQLIERLTNYVQARYGKVEGEWIKKSGISVHFKMPILDDPRNGYVQIDFMFTKGGPEDTKWMKFSMYSAGDASAYSGADRNMLMSSIAKAQGMKYSWQKGLIRREDEALISKDPDTIAQKLLGPQFDHTALLSVETIQSALDDRSDLKAQLLKLADNLESDHAPDGTPIKPGQLRVNQEEAARIRRLIGS